MNQNELEKYKGNPRCPKCGAELPAHAPCDLPFHVNIVSLGVPFCCEQCGAHFTEIYDLADVVVEEDEDDDGDTSRRIYLSEGGQL